MSVPTTVPETHGRSDDDAREVLRRVGLVRLSVNAGRRFHAADGTSYARALGLSSVLSLLPGLVGAVGLVTVFDLERTRAVLSDVLQSVAPGPAGSLLSEALRPGSSAVTAMLAGFAGMLLSGTFTMVHLERGANRVYGVDEHRGVRRRFGTAFLIAASAGILLLIALGVIVAGGAIGDAGRSAGAPAGSSTGWWSVLRWPIAIALVAGPMTMIFKVAPNRRQPRFSWLLSGTVVAVVLWIVVTLSLGLFYEHAQAGNAYGQLLGVLAVLVWAYLTGAAVLYGLAFAAELEAERAGVSQPDRQGEGASAEDDEDVVRV